MQVQVVLTVSVPVIVSQHLVSVQVSVGLPQVQPHPQGHQRCGGDQWQADGLPKDHGEHRTEERRHREIRAGARRSQVTQTDDEQDLAEP